ncbi:MAG: potassium channel protein [Krumholzibacteria bacterium]|nr:potassium channel protein [Candidatus Krumholzibacteria bacterium]
MKFMSAQLATLMHGGGRRSNIRLLVRFLVLLTAVITLYSLLFHVLMMHEGQQHSWVTGFYWTLTVMSTLGFGDITFSGDAGRVFSIIVLLSGVIFLMVMLPFTFIRFFYAPWLEAQNRARAPRVLPQGIRGHVVVTRFNNEAANLIERLVQLGIPSVVLVPELGEALDLFDRGYRVMIGDLNHPDTYRNLRVHEAALVVVLNDDFAATNIIHTVRETCDHVPTVVNADHDDSVDILQLAGSSHVFQFHRILGQALARRVLGVDLRANVIGRMDELLIAEVPAMATVLPGQTLIQSRLRERSGVNVVGVWEQGVFRLPTPQTTIEPTSVLVLAGSAAQLDRFEELERAPDHPQRQRGPVLILGGGRVGRAVADSLEQRGIDYRIVEKRAMPGGGGAKVIVGSAADRATLVEAGIERTPSIIITTHEDDLNVYLAIYCRRLRPDAQIISRATLNRNVKTLHRAGANLVMSYSSITTATIVNLLRPGSLIMLSESLSVFTATVDQRLHGRTLADLRLRPETGCSVIAIKRDGAMVVNPDPAAGLQRGEELVLVGDAEAMGRFLARYPSAGPKAPR